MASQLWLAMPRSPPPLKTIPLDLAAVNA